MDHANQQKAQARREPKILIVEDDITFVPYWTILVGRVHRGAKLFWAESETQAERMIFESIEKNDEFDLIITDIFLSGGGTGFDLWDKFFKKLDGRIILTSAIDFQKFAMYFEKSELRPPFLHKPLIPDECIETISEILREGH